MINVRLFTLESTFLHEFYELCVLIWCPERAFNELSLGTKFGITKIKTRGERSTQKVVHPLFDSAFDSAFEPKFKHTVLREFLFVCFQIGCPEKAHRKLSLDTKSGRTTCKTH